MINEIKSDDILFYGIGYLVAAFYAVSLLSGPGLDFGIGGIDLTKDEGSEILTMRQGTMHVTG